jgi:CheY-like chemotaxis protein
VRRIVAGALRRWGHTVREAANGAEALEMAQAHSSSIHLLVTDLMMPGMTGVALAGTLRKAMPDLAVVLMSGYAEDTTNERGATEIENVRFLEKPFTLETLRAAVDAAKPSMTPSEAHV